MDASTYIVNVSAEGISIGVDNILWDNVKDTLGNSLNSEIIGNQEFSFSYKGIDISFQTKMGDTFEDIINAMDQVSFDVNRTTESLSKVSIINSGVKAGTETDEFLSKNGTRYHYEGGYKVFANETGIGIEGYPMLTWNSLGIDLEHAGGQIIDFSDTVSGVYFSAQISADATKSEIVSSFNNSKFYWGYIDMSSKENARLGYSAKSVETTITNPATAPVKPNTVTVNKIFDSLYNNLGYTTNSQKLLGLKLSLTIEGSTPQDLKVIFHAENGNEYSLPYYSWDPGIYHYANPSGRATIKFGYNDGAQVGISMTYSTAHVPEDDDAYGYLGTLGEIATNVIIPSPFEFKYKTNTLSKTIYDIENIKTKDQLVDKDEKPLKLWIQSGAEAGQGMFLEIDKMNTSVLGLDDTDVSTVEGAGKAITAAKKALAKVNRNRSKIGAQQNRLEHTVKNNENTSENTQAAESQIRDTDMAKEMVEFAKHNILEQVGQSMMAQANQSNQGVLSLLQ